MIRDFIGAVAIFGGMYATIIIMHGAGL